MTTLSQPANVTMTTLSELPNVTMTMLSALLNATVTTLPELQNDILIPSAVKHGDCATTTPWMGNSAVNTKSSANPASAVNTTTSNITTACPVVPLPQQTSGSGLNAPFLVQCVIGLGIILANASILVVLRRCRPAGPILHYLLQHLACADLGMAVATFTRIGLIGRYGDTVEDNPRRCIPVVILYLVSTGVSISSLLLIAIDQWYTATQNVSLLSRQRWRRCSRWAAVCSWVIWITIGVLCIPAIKAPGTYLRPKAACLMTGPFAENVYWQFAGLPLIGLCAVTATFQWLSLQAARANTKMLMAALRRRHEGYVWEGKVPSSISQMPQKQIKRSGTIISFLTSKASCRNVNNSAVSSGQVRKSEVPSPERRSVKVLHGQTSTCKDATTCSICNAPSTSKQGAVCKVSRKISDKESSFMTLESIASSGKVSFHENSDKITSTTSTQNANEMCRKLSVKKVHVSRMKHPEVSWRNTGNPTVMTTSSFAMFQCGSINRISPVDPTALPIKGDYYEMKLANTRLHLTRTISIVLALFVGSWFFYLPFSLILSACGPACHTIQSKVAYAGTLAIANSLMNAIIYTFRIKQYRVALRNMLCGVSTRGSNAIVPTINVTTIRELALPPIY